MRPTHCSVAPMPQEARLRDLMDDLHASFKDRVREARGNRLAAGRDDELFSGGCRMGGGHLAQPCVPPQSALVFPRTPAKC